MNRSSIDFFNFPPSPLIFLIFPPVLEYSFIVCESLQGAEDVGIDENDKGSLESDPQELPMTFLISGSSSFRQRLIKLRTDSIFCSLMNTSLGQLAPDSVWRELLTGGKELEFGKQGQIVYESRKAQASKQWYVVVTGKLRVTLDIEQEAHEHDSPRESGDELIDVEQYEISAGDVFGGYCIAVNCNPTDVKHVRVETLESSKILELSGEYLTNLLKENGEIASLLLSRMGGKTLCQ